MLQSSALFFPSELNHTQRHAALQSTMWLKMGLHYVTKRVSSFFDVCWKVQEYITWSKENCIPAVLIIIATTKVAFFLLVFKYYIRNIYIWRQETSQCLDVFERFQERYEIA